MKTIRTLAAAALAAALVAPAFAGGAECEKKMKGAATASNHKCTATWEECQKYLESMKSSAWLGVELDDETMAITKIVAGSPAEKSGFRTGDILVAMNGIDYGKANHEKLMAAKKAIQVGDSVTYTIKRDGAQQDVSARLAKMPEAVYTTFYADHKKEHVEVASK